jgi:ABC-type branched-subunit amino acid transport system substrate-binding protein
MRASSNKLPARRLAFGAAGTLLAGATVLASWLGASACASKATGGGTGAMNPAGAPIVIGASIDQTGSLKGNASAMKGGLLAAVQQVNALGGILGRQVEVVTQDDTGTPGTAASVATSLQGMNVSALLGPIGSGEVTAVLPFIEKSKLVEVSSTATSVELTGACKPAPKTTCPTGASYQAGNSYFFRTVPSDALQAVAVGVFAQHGPSGDAGTGACHTMDVVHNDDSYGNPLSAALETYFTSKGGVIGTDFPVSASALDASGYQMDVSTIFTDLPDCLVLAVYPETAANFMGELTTQLQSAAKPAKWSKTFFVIGTDGAYDPSLITYGLEDMSKPMGASFVNGTLGPPVYGTVAQTNDATRSQYNELVNLYVAEVGFDPGATDLDPYTSNQYDATILTLLAMQAAGTTTDGAKIQKAMFDVSKGKTSSPVPIGPLDIGSALSTLANGGDINYQGASGDVDFDAFGNVIANFLIWEVKGQGFVNHDVILASELGATP